MKANALSFELPGLRGHVNGYFIIDTLKPISANLT